LTAVACSVGGSDRGHPNAAHTVGSASKSLHRGPDFTRLATSVVDGALTVPESSLLTRPRIGAAKIAASAQLARDAHAGSFCHDGVTPFIAHVEQVAALVRSAHVSNEIVCSAYLRDVCEHAGVAPGVIRDRFGPVVARLVNALTQPAVEPVTGRRSSWSHRRRATVMEAAVAPSDVVVLKSADLVANIDQLVRGARLVGDAVWDRYPVGGARQAGYYLALGAILEHRLTDPTLEVELAGSLTRLRALVAEHRIQPQGRYAPRSAKSGSSSHTQIATIATARAPRAASTA
jgi:(p)ppGpp synthase/HD superfamily hydrolase